MKLVHERGWLYLGHRSTDWCPRCGTSLSQHELSQAGVYQERADPSLFVRLPLLDRHGEALVVWTTTPWTLPANVAAAVRPDAEYGLTDNGHWLAVGRYPDETFTQRLRGERARRLALRGTVRRARARRRGRAPRHPVGRRHARPGHRHRPHRPGLRRRGLRALQGARPAGADARRRGRALLRRLRLAAREVDRRGRGPDRRRPEGARPARRGRPLRARLSALLALRYAADLPHRRRLAHLGRRAPAPAPRGERERRVDAGVLLEAHGRLAPQHGRLEHLAAPLLRAAASLLPLRLRAPERGRLAGRARGARASAASTSSRSCAGRGSTTVAIRCEECGEAVRRITEVGDVWLDAGIVPFSTLGWQNPTWVDAGLRHRRRARGLTGADLPDHAYWEQWFPADWVSEMREQIRLWFYSQLFMSVALVGRGAVPEGARLREDARRARPRDARLVGEPDPGRGRVRAAWAPTSCAGSTARSRPTATSSSATGRRTRSSGASSASGTRSSSWSTTAQRGRVHARPGGTSGSRSIRSTAGSSSARPSSWPRRPRPTSSS